MGGPHVKGRRHGRMHELPADLLKQVNGLLVEPDTTYDDIRDFLKGRGYDISRSAIGRYGKSFLNILRETRIIEDKAAALVSEAASGLVLAEAADKLLAKKLIELLLADGVDLAATTRIMGDFAKLQSSSVQRERMKADLKKKTEKAVESIEKIVKKSGLSDATAAQIRQKILGIGE